MKKRLLAMLMAGAMALSMAACGGNTSGENSDASGGEQAAEGSAKIGVSMPTQSLQRWNQDGTNMKEQLEAAGYTVDLQYAGDNDIPTQVSQIENMISSGCDVLVIAAIDGSALSEALKGAKDNNIPVISYDRLIMNSDAVSYYATFDNYKVGTMQGEYIRDALDLDNAAGPFNIELVTGAPDDNNVNFFFGGAMDVLQPYIDEGKLVVPSGQTEKAQCATANWSTEEAQKRFENIITSVGYGPNGVKLDAVLCSNDSTSYGVQNALLAAGYTAENMPVITGQDCDKPNVKNYRHRETFMGFHCGNTCPSLLRNPHMGYQLIMKRDLEPDLAEPDITRGTMEGDIKAGDITFFRLQSTASTQLRAYVAQGEVLDVPTESFGSIGVFAIPEMDRFYRHVLIEKQYPHHGAVAFGHYGKALFEVFRYLGVADIAYNQPASLPYPTENPFH